MDWTSEAGLAELERLFAAERAAKDAALIGWPIANLEPVQRFPERAAIEAHGRAVGALVVATMEAAPALAAEIRRLREKLKDARRVCTMPGCLAIVIRNDDGSRVCAGGHASRWVDAADLTAEREAHEEAKLRLAIATGEGVPEGWTRASYRDNRGARLERVKPGVRAWVFPDGTWEVRRSGVPRAEGHPGPRPIRQAMAEAEKWLVEQEVKS